MTQIMEDSGSIALINTFTVAPGKADALVELLDEATEQTMRHRPGFISANIHRSLDGTRIANYAQWRSKADFEAMMADPDARVHQRAAADLADGFDPVLYEIVTVHEAA